MGVSIVTTYGCDCSSGPQKFARRNVSCEVYHGDLFEKDLGIVLLKVGKYLWPHRGRSEGFPLHSPRSLRLHDAWRQHPHNHCHPCDS